MFYVFGLLLFITFLFTRTSRKCWGETIPVNQSGEINIKVQGKPSHVFAKFVDPSKCDPSCAHSADTVNIKIVAGENCYLVNISWCVFNGRMLEYGICGCKKILTN